MKIFHLGSIDDYHRHDGNPNAYNAMLHTYGDNRLFVAVFEDEASSSLCTLLFTEIKNCAANINMEHRLGNISLAEKSHRYRTIWIPITERYIAEWGLHMVPLDIRRSIADVRSCLGLSNVLWPAILYRDDDVGPDVIVPDCVDSFGMVLDD